MFGRVLGGIATSILYSAFESWLVYQHNKVTTRHLAFFFFFVMVLTSDYLEWVSR